jgi:hypothetical protein
MARLESKIPSFGGRVGVGLFINTLKNAEPLRQVYLSHGLPWFTETKATFSIDIVRDEFNLNGLPDSAVHISGFRGQDGRIVELNAVSLVDTVFSYGRLLPMF